MGKFHDKPKKGLGEVKASALTAGTLSLKQNKTKILLSQLGGIKLLRFQCGKVNLLVMILFL